LSGIKDFCGMRMHQYIVQIQMPALCILKTTRSYISIKREP
jgi:hypothetical protein